LGIVMVRAELPKSGSPSVEDQLILGLGITIQSAQ
jgi:hypothetical protein